MLERVPATAESAAHLFLRSLETPCRSTRLLDPKFWRHGVDDLDTPAWWPLYLQQVRQVPHARHPPREESKVKRWSTRNTPNRTDVKAPQPQAHSARTRSFTASASPTQQGQAQQKIYDAFGLGEDVEDHNPRQPDVQQPLAENVWALRRKARREEREALESDLEESLHFNSEASQQTPATSQHLASRYPAFDHHTRPASTTPHKNIDNEEFGPRGPQIKKAEKRSRLRDMLDASDQSLSDFAELLHKRDRLGADDFDQAWRLFIALDVQEKVASHMFSFLTRSQRASDLPRAIEAFRLIPRDERSAAHYRAAISLEQRRYQHRSAMNLAFEATIQGFNPLPDLLAYFVQNLLWNSVAELLHRSRTARKDIKLWKSRENVKDMHLKVLSLADRLRSSNADLLEHKDLLESFCKRLAFSCVRNSTLMRSIPASGLLALFHLQETLGNLRLHQAALHTILHLPNREDKADIALMIYRNFRFMLPHETVPKSILGGLIGICSEADYSLETYNFLLLEFRMAYGIPDERAYQRILTSCARQGNVDAVERVFAQYRLNHPNISNITYLSPLVYCHAVIGDAVNARKQFDRLKEEFGFEPNSTCWNMLLLAHARSNDDLSTFDVFDEMRKTKIRPTGYTYGTLLSICAEHGDTETALELLANARDGGLQISVPMVNTVVEAYLSHHDVQAAMRFAIATSESGTSASLTRLWNSLIRYFAAKADIPALMNARNMMSKYNVEADEMTYAAIISALVLMHKTTEAVTMIREMHYNQGLTANAFHYSIVLHGFVRERNRDMVAVIANEMRQRFPKITRNANRALLLLESQRDDSFKSQDPHSLRLVASILEDLYASGSTSPQFDRSFGKPQETSALASVYFETIVESMVQHGSYESAAQLLDHLDPAMNSADTSISMRSMKFVLARMDVAIALGDQQTLSSIWRRLFEHASKNLKPIRNIREQRKSQTAILEGTKSDTTQPDAASLGSPRPDSETPVLKAWRTSLSKPLNRYMEAMARADCTDEMIDFVKHRFRAAGFTLTGTNWNKYIQVLCRSKGANHHVHAFAMTEKLMLNRAQSWKLLKRGLLRQKATSYVFEAIGEHKRPVLQERTTYNVANRLDVLRSHSRRIIPTYTTMVHLSSVLLYAERKAANGSLGEIKTLGQVAPGTKKFLQQMPYLKDDVQGDLLHSLESGRNPRSRPRSEQSIRAKTDTSGILGSKSPLDHLPADFLQDIKTTISPRDDIRYLLKGSVVPVKFSRSDEQDVQLGENFFGKIARDSIVLAGKGRFETDSERAHRVKWQEREMVKKVQAVRKDLRERQLTGEVYQRDAESPVGGPLCAGPVPLGESEATSPKTPSALLLQALERREGGGLQSKRSLQDTLADLPVHTQVKTLQELRKEVNKASSQKPPSRKLFLPYAERRRIRRIRANKQRQEASGLLDHLGRENVSDRALQPRTAAGRRALLFEQAQRRRQEYLQYEADTKAGRRVDPFPRTERGYWNRLLRQGQPAVRFVADLNRHPHRYLIRRGEMVEKRRPRVSPRGVEMRKFKATTKRMKPRMKKKDRLAIRRAIRGLPLVVKRRSQAVAIGRQIRDEARLEGELYMPR